MWGVIVKEVELQVDLRIGRIELGKKRKITPDLCKGSIGVGWGRWTAGCLM